MKKIILPIAIVLTMLFSACSSNEPLVDDTTNKCWEYTVSTHGVTLPPDYVWCTAKEFGEIKSEIEAMGMGITYRSVDKSQSSACSSNEPIVDDVTERCWEYNYSAFGYSVKDYYWATAKDFGEYKTMLESMYGTVTSYKAVSKSESECVSSEY